MVFTERSHNINGILNITDSVVTGNSVTKNNGVGGGIRSTGSTGSNHTDPKVTITNSEISYNHADGGLGDGGGIYSDAYTILSIKGGSTISNNTAGRDGGGIYSDGNTILTIQGGSTISNNTAGRDGGGIYSWHESTLDIANSTIKNNISDGKGGGIFIDIGSGSYKNSAESQIFYSRIEGNEARQGGGIFNNGELLVYGSTIDSNTALEKNTANLREGCGGGIFNGEGGQLFIYDCTISYNNADINGGGVAAYRPPDVILVPTPGVWQAKYVLLGITALIDYLRPLEPFTIYNSTIAFNKAGLADNNNNNYNIIGYGGGIYTNSKTGIYNCTIARNGGGGLYRANYTISTTSLLNIENVILANNSYGLSNYIFPDYSAEIAIFGAEPSTRLYGDISRLIVSDWSFDNIALGLDGFLPRSHVNLNDGDYSGQTFGDNPINFIIANPHLGPLQDNGGPTFTMALLEHSKAIDQGTNVLSNRSLDFAGLINFDQRGQGRVATGRSVTGVVDIGAFEYQPLATTAKLVTGTSATSGASRLRLEDPVTHERIEVEDPFPGFTGKIHVASGDYNGDFNGDGIGDIVVGAGEGGGPAVAIIDSQTGRVITSFFAFDPEFRGGIDLASLDFNLDGVMDIIVGAGPGGGPHVKIFNGKDLSLLFSFYAYANNFSGGVSICALDVNDDGIRDLVTGAGVGGAPHVKVWDGATHTLLSQWFAYALDFRGGVNVSGGYLGSDGTVEVVTGAGAGMAPEVAVWDPLTGEEISRFLAYSSQFMGGVRVRVHDGNGDGVSELVTAAGPGGAPHVRGFNFPALDLAFEFFAGKITDTDGVFVS